MDDEDELPSEDLGERLANLGRATVALLPKFANIRKVRDRLLGDVSDAALDGLVSRLRLYQTRNQTEAIRIAIDRTGLPPAHVQDAFRRQESLDKIAASALLQVAHDTAASENSGPDGASTSDEWFDVFRREAADRSAGDMREAFGRILAGEIRQPGTFSVHSLRVLGTISTNTATKFRRAASVSICSTIQPDARVPATGGQLGQNCLLDVGLSYDVLMQLTESGLLLPDLTSRMPYGPIKLPELRIANQPSTVSLPFRHQGKQWILRPSTDEMKVGELRVDGAAFTTAGRELLTVVDMEDMPEFTERLKAHFAKSKHEMVEVPQGVGPFKVN